MFDRIFANYLVERGTLTEDQLELIFSAKEKRRARLGVIAVAEKVMTAEEADEVNQLQALYDKRFGDIAIEHGYLTEEQVARLLDLQGNNFLAFVQSSIDSNILTIDEIDNGLSKFQADYSLTMGDIESLKSCDLDLIVPVIMHRLDPLLIDISSIMLRTVYRLIDYNFYIKKPYITNEIRYDSISMQELFGDHAILNAITGSKEAMKNAAVGFAGAEHIEDEEDVLDAMCEFINCVNGLLASKLSSENTDVDMKPPFYSTSNGTIKGESLLCIPLMVFGKEITITFTLDSDFTNN